MSQTEKIKEFFSIIEKVDNILIVNSKPDGDSIGSSLALQKILTKLGKKAQSFTFSPIPDYLRFLVERGEITFEAEVERNAFKHIEVIILVDGSNLKRAQNNREVDWKEDVKVLCIDHHQLNGDIEEATLTKEEVASSTPIVQPSSKNLYFSLIDPLSESTCGLLTELCVERKKESGDDLLDQNVAFLLFTGIVSDTDYFGYANVSKRTFEHAAILMDFQFDIIPIIKQFRESLGLKAFKFIQRNIGKVVINEEKRYAYLKIMREDYTEDDNLGVINEAANFLNRAIMRIVDCVDFSFIIREVNDTRSSLALRRHNNGNTVDLSKIASKFGGGGHVQAAGAVLEKQVNELEKELLEYLDSYLISTEILSE